MSKYFRIGEISKMYHIGTDSLRYYEKIGILSPKRGENQYRLYRTEDIWRLNVIRELRELGFSMEQIGVYLKDHTVSTTRMLLEEELRMIQEKQEKLRLLKKNVNERIRMHFGKEYGVEIISEPDEGTIMRMRMPIQKTEKKEGGRRV